MDQRRAFLCAALGVVIYCLVNAWQTDYPAPAVVRPAAMQATTDLNPSPIGLDTPAPLLNQSAPRPSVETPQSELIDLKTDVLALKINRLNGDIVGADLLDYPVSLAEKDSPYPLLTPNVPGKYIAVSQLVSATDSGTKPLQMRFTSSQTAYQLAENQQQLVVTLEGQDANGLAVKKEFIVSRGSYVVDVRFDVKNAGQMIWNGYVNNQLLRESPAEDKSSPFHVGSYTGASYSNPGVHRYQKVTFKEMSKNNVEQTVTGGWVAMQQRYFLSAWIPDPTSKNRIYTRSAQDGTYVIGSVGQSLALKPNESQSLQSKLYVGPEVADNLSAVAPGLDLTIDYGWLWFISSILFSVMKAIHQVVGNWGWSIVLVTALVKLVFYRLSATSYRSMAAMRKLQPKMQALRERYGDDKAKISQATMELYRQEKINPLAGCLPLLIQIPVMIALYWVMIESVELRQAPFILWITDLALPDPWHVLPILMGCTMFIQQQLNPAPPDPMQARIMMFLPLLFTGLFWNFPSGLVLYWTVNNSLTILQQWFITRQYEAPKPALKKKLALVK